jgi:hypothetical protein
MKSRKIKWARHVARIRKMRNSYKISVGEPEGKRFLEDLGVDGKILLEWILEK